MKFQWEKLVKSEGDGFYIITMRAKVIGGWIINQSHWVGDTDIKQSITTALTFVPDAKHKWEIDNE